MGPTADIDWTDVAALELLARDRLDPAAYDYFAGGAGDEITIDDNVAAWRRVWLRPHVLRDVTQVSTASTLFERPLTMPMLVAPMGYQRLADEEGEAATARGAAKAGATMVVSTVSTVSLEDVAAAAAEGSHWFQLYVSPDRAAAEALVRRAEAAGYEAIVFTVDVPRLGRRRRDERNRFTLPEGMEMANLETPMPAVEGSGLAAYSDEGFDPGLTLDDVGWLRDLTELPVLVKGILRPDDAAAVVAAGAAGIIVSNHGGRQLDSSIPTAGALPDVVAAVDRRVPLLVDGGIRGGGDILKALAMGANAVLLGRPVLWALTIAGAAGVAGFLEAMRADLENAMALCGVRTIDEVSEDLVALA